MHLIRSDVNVHSCGQRVLGKRESLLCHVTPIILFAWTTYTKLLCGMQQVVKGSDKAATTL